MPSVILIYPIWPQYTNVTGKTDKTDRQAIAMTAMGEPFYKRSPEKLKFIFIH